MPRMTHVILASALSILPLSAKAATFQIDFSLAGSNNIIGTFTAPAGGGTVSNLMVQMFNVLFDTRIDAGGPFDYDPAAGDFVNYSAFPTYTNATGNATCAATQCTLQIYPLPNDPTPGDYLAVDGNLNNIDDGTKYAISGPSPVPLPGAAGLMALALGGLAGLRLRRG
ncbi:hypothetical protein AB0T83_10005 [Fluviibacterium sp. DFM31]|uniref:PEP-CTERM sorting domain-containing protein n=1 Tax=Meridianimarinicoccus marinus TaxID=3231483 RepID=A0ABV3L6B7_9RHOB